VRRWTDEIGKRPAVQRGVKVNRTWGEAHEQVPERHGPDDFRR
jgi:GST-like protein